MLATFALLACTACQGGAPGADVVQRDSAGIVIVENTITARALASWRVGPDPDFELPRAPTDSASRVAVIGGIAYVRDALVVVDTGRNEVRIFDRDGAALHRFGGRGSGAGQFRAPHLVMSHDMQSILVHDVLTRRFTRIAVDGSVVETIDATRTNAQAVAARGHHVLTFHSVSDIGGAAGAREYTAGFGVLDLRSGVLDTIGRFPGQLHYRTQLGPRPAIFTVPFDVMPSAAAGEDWFFITDGEQPEIRTYDSSGVLRRIIRVAEPTRAVSRAEFDSAAERAALHQLDADGDPTALRAVYAQMPLPRVRPAFDRIIVDEIGWLWAHRYEPDRNVPGVWLVFDRDGRARSAVALPVPLEVHQIGSDYVLGRWRDDDGVEHVRRYPLTKTR